MGIAVSRWNCAAILKKMGPRHRKYFFATLVFEKHNKNTILVRILEKKKVEKVVSLPPTRFFGFLTRFHHG